ncbi:alpha/beta hydrolase [Salinigranum rubrum]|uniref:Palmitoyl-protein thioesterase ABHD10, mitochondrial n=1 Tax=Salinigranum rubrum TaxID=755307 RepID=A0A2I8VQS7_9EURY|nr:alpha/beta fold hydrolase [Salinigranum rubrum]AUV83489.1 alpha/beta hydrolase [Salinigranum rubrum]
MPTTHAVTTDTGERLAAVHHAPETAGTETWLVFCHGFVSDKSGSYEGRCARAAEEGYHAVRFDFRGCGESAGEFVDQTLRSKVADLRAVLAHFDAPSYALVGSSFGAKTAFHAAVDSDRRIRAVAGRAPLTYNRTFDGMRAVVEREGEFTYDTGHTVDERFFADFERYAFDDVTDELTVPVALFHGADDESVAPGDSLDATAAFDVSVLLQVLAGEGHRFSRPAEVRFRRQLFDWLALTLAERE